MPGGSGGTPAGDAIAAGLARIRRRRLGLLLVVLALPAVLLLFFHAPWARATRELVVLAWVAAWGAAVMAVVWSRCPRCGHLFHRVLGFANPLSRRCQGCGRSL